jgi:hypothetical protein
MNSSVVKTRGAILSWDKSTGSLITVWAATGVEGA